MNRVGFFGSFPLSVRLLLMNHLLGNIGFYMLVPFLADYLLTDLALSATVVGVVLGVRSLSQQGLFLVGGSASDRLGARGVIIIGAGIRSVGFVSFAVGGSLPVVLLGSVLTGFAGALFNPAVRAYIARDSGNRSAHAFAVFNVMGNIGSAVGPLVGALLIGAGFRLTAVAAAAVFATLTLAQLLLLPAPPVTARDTALSADLVRVFTDVRFWGFASALMGMFALQSQIYFLFTLQIQQLAGQAAVAALFLVETAAVVACQVPVTRALSRRRDRGPAMAAGMALLGGAFLVPPLGAMLTDSRPLALTVCLLPVLAAAVVLAVGVAMVQPFVSEAIPRFTGTALTGTYFGAFYLASGIFTVATTSGLGALIDRSGGPSAWPPALCCTGIGVVSACGILALRRRGFLSAVETSPPPEQFTTKGDTQR
ncbi:MFS transporter [Nocardia sp. NBC_00881]|uniref:MFS transporter n=1 Tax=Nocardia sp. NBC_00881 TaxID=2975995 RepID=UPI00386F0397|nr:MFS transporter [Nocardia sp. NBC_00881]